MLIFTPLTSEDLPFLIEVRNECRHSLHDNRLFTLAECEIWFRHQKPDFQIIRRGEDRVGYIRLSNHNHQDASIYIGADLHLRFRGQGLARLAYESFLPLLKERYQVSVVKLEVLSNNTVAHGLYLKLGFVEVGRKLGAYSRKSGMVDSIVMELYL
jgi:RimJ/RimL family protein N-acetyltransferase